MNHQDNNYKHEIIPQTSSTLSASYYLLYNNSAASWDSYKPTSRKLDTPKTVISSTINSPSDINSWSNNNDNNNDNNFWKEEKWTDEDEMKAKQKLEKNRQKCQLVPINNSHHGKEQMDPNHNKGSYWVQKYENDADLHWDGFYQRNQTNFFKDRHYLHKTFPIEARYFYEDSTMESHKDHGYILYEIGCGVGNNILPLLSKNSYLHVHCFDFSSVAIELLNQNSQFHNAVQEGRASAHIWDITQPLSTAIKKSITIQEPRFENFILSDYHAVADCTMLLFCLSAVNPSKMQMAVHNVASTLKPGGVILFRDYGRYDEAQMKLGSQRGKELGENFYVKHDGTRCYYFDLNDLKQLFGNGCDTSSDENNTSHEKKGSRSGAGLEILDLHYIRRSYKNRGTQTVRRRVWVQGRFRKPLLE